MKTILRLGPADHGRRVTEEEFSTSSYETGYQYEIIDGKLYVSPAADPPQEIIESWLFFLLRLYSRDHPEVTNHVACKGRVFVSDRPEVTVPEPDITAYRDFPLDRPFREIRWQTTIPILVVEVMSESNADKDLVRNRELYLQVPSIREYWILDTRENPDEPTLLVHRRHGRRWRNLEFGYGETYTTRLLPGFSLLIDPRK